MVKKLLADGYVVNVYDNNKDTIKKEEELNAVVGSIYIGSKGLFMQKTKVVIV